MFCRQYGGLSGTIAAMFTIVIKTCEEMFIIFIWL